MIRDFSWTLNDVHRDRVYCETTTMPAEFVNGRPTLASQDGRLRSSTHAVGTPSNLLSVWLSL